jgi:hypothetical protein
MRRVRVIRGNVDRADSERATLTDTSPTDVPIIISNDGFHANLRSAVATPELKKLIEKLVTSNPERYTIPYRYRIRLSSTASRQLSLGHPSAQYQACKFYEKYAHLIPYFCRHAEVSLRRPTRIGSAVFHLTGISEKKRYKGAAIDVLLHDRTVRNPGSFFVYEKYDRFYKFFKSTEFVELEKTFSMMRVTDISKCFSSIYSHTLAWAVKDVQHGKENTFAGSFANDFDRLMQFSNYNETNGIPVGAEISRLFAEIVLQAADVGLLRRAERNQLQAGRDFVIRRYIDDYIIFANSIDELDSVQRGLNDALSVFNLHLNEAKTYTIQRPLQTRKSQIVAQAAIGLATFRGRVSTFDEQRHVYIPAFVRSAPALVGTLVDDMKVACANAEAGYEEISPYAIGSIANTVESLIESFRLARKTPQFSLENYASAFEALLRSLYFFFTVHVTVPASYQVAKTTVLSVRFFNQNLPESADFINEVVRSLIADVIGISALHSVKMSDCVPIEIMNIVLASSELPVRFRPEISEIRNRILTDETVDYFSYISLLFYYGNNDPSFVSDVEKQLEFRFVERASPRKESHDAHFMLDLLACPYLSMPFRMKVWRALRKNLELPFHFVIRGPTLIAEIEGSPWFVNWRQIDLLNHLRKKELRAVY